MENWKSDATLSIMANALGYKVVEMYDSCGLTIPRTYFDPHGPVHSSPSKSAEATFVKCFILDAEDFMSMDPQKLIDEYRRMQKAADATYGNNAEALANLDLAQARIAANWHGEAADGFAKQMTKIRLFMEQQHERLVYAMQAMGAAFGLAVQFRRNYFDLAQHTFEVCSAVIAKRPPEPSVSGVMFALGRDVVKLGVSAAGTKNPKDLAKVGIDWFKEQAEKAQMDRASIGGGDAPAVLRSYLDARQRLRDSLDEGLSQLGAWLDQERSAYFSLAVPILEPMPASTDVRSPDFSYGKFFNDGHDPGAYTPKVDRERKKLADENPRSEGPIHRRLKGEE